VILVLPLGFNIMKKKKRLFAVRQTTLLHKFFKERATPMRLMFGQLELSFTLCSSENRHLKLLKLKPLIRKLRPAIMRFPII